MYCLNLLKSISNQLHG